MLHKRLAASAVILTALGILLHFDFHHPLMGVGGLLLLPLLLVIALMATAELGEMLIKGGLELRLKHVLISVALVHCLTFLPSLMDAFSSSGYPNDCPVGRVGWIGVGSVLAMCWLFFVEMKHFKEPGGAIQRLANGMLVVAYTGTAMSFLTVLRTLRVSETGYDGAWGMCAIISVIVITKCGDSGAYFTGKSVGKHKMSPILSPKKTIEGAVGAFVCGMGAAIAFGRWVVPAILAMVVDVDVAGSSAEVGPMWAWALYGLVITAAGMVGDLAESLIKRDSQVKDSSSWVPGLGGVLDIMDSITFSLVPAYLFWISNWLTVS
ncbi:MAG: phosphatidate cytidylyltransferase [Planctomycetota bacterium]|nr:phosphatidate cytidylyltransferase [Planctomycetota bacterium]